MFKNKNPFFLPPLLILISSLLYQYFLIFFNLSFPSIIAYVLLIYATTNIFLIFHTKIFNSPQIWFYNEKYWLYMACNVDIIFITCISYSMVSYLNNVYLIFIKLFCFIFIICFLIKGIFNKQIINVILKFIFFFIIIITTISTQFGIQLAITMFIDSITI